MRNEAVKKAILPILGLSLVLGSSLVLAAKSKEAEQVSGYSASSLPTTIDLNDTTDSNIRSYYSSLNSLSESERKGSNLLKNLKTILKNGQKYYSYENGENVWKMYEITDRDWDKSPASSISGYNSSTKKITGYSYNSSDPYIHALYVNRDVDNKTTAWSDHQQTQWGINREHVWPKAEGFDSSGAGGARGDPRHLMAGNGYANNIHSNYYYGYVKSSGATDCGSKYSNLSGNLKGTSKTLNTGTVFEPQDSDKGDIARSIFYMVARYNYLSGSDSDGIDTNNPNLTLTQNISDWSSSGYTSSKTTQGKLGVLTDLLAWHKADPVDEYEKHRNNLLYTNFTNNRNPFIDFPEWADFIWGTATYNGSTYQSYSSTPTGSATPSSDTINGYNSSGGTVSVTGVSLNKNSTSIEVGGAETLEATIAPSNATNKGVSWTSSNTGVATVNNGVVRGVAEGNSTITVTTSDGSFTATCTVTVTASSGGGGDSQVSNVIFTLGEDGAASHVDGNGADTYSETKSDVNLSLSSGVKMYTDAKDAQGNGCLKFGTSGNGGSFTIDLSSVNNLSSVILRASNYKATTGTTVTINSGTPTTLTKQSNNGQYDEITVNITNQTSLSVVFSARAMLNEIEFVFASSSSKALDSITLDTSDAPTTFNVGDTFSYEGLSITANYDDGTDDIVTPTSVSTPNLSTAGQKTVTVSYTEGGVTKTATYTVTVNAVTLSSIEVSDAKTAYYVGDTFVNPTVTATFSNGSTSDVTNSATFSGYNLSNAGNQTVSVSYTNGTTVNTSYSITVTALAVTSIAVSGQTTQFNVGDTFAFGGTVTATYNNGSNADVTASATFTGYNMSTTGNQTVTVSFGGQSTTYQISITESSSSETGTYTINLAIVSYETPTSTSLVTWNTDCLVMTAEQATGKTAANNYLGGDSNSRTSSRFYTGNTLRFVPLANYEITSVVFTASSSAYANALRDSTWTNASASVSNTSVTITPTDGSTEFYAVHNAQTGGTSIVINYSYITPASLSLITLDTTNVQITFSVGDTFNYTGLVVTAHYSDSSSKTVTPTSVSSPNMSTTGNKSVTVTYTEDEVTESAQYSITVNADPSISWSAPTINVYSGSTLSGSDVNGWSVTYNDGAGHQTVLTYSQLTVRLGGSTISIPHTWLASDDGKTLTATYNSVTTSESSSVQITQTINRIDASLDDTYDYTFESKQYSAVGAVNLGGHSWTQAGTGNGYWGYEAARGQQFGSGGNPYSALSLTSSDFSGTVDSVTVYTSGGSSVAATVQVSVGGTFYGSAQSITTSNTAYTFDLGGKSGDIVISWTQTSSKALYVKEIVVNTSGTSTISNNVEHIEAQRLAVLFAKTFNEFMDDTQNCTTGLDAAWASCSTAYTLFKSSAASLGETEEAWCLNLIKYTTAQYSDDSGEACIERMMKTYEVCVQKHGKTGFMSDLVTVGSNTVSPLVNVVGDNKATIIIVIVSLISASTIAGYFFIKRRKPE